MSKMGDMMIEIQQYIVEHPQMSFQSIAKLLNVPIEWVYDVADEMGEFDD
jgi:NADH:ubiquinone oxidoreductase subunit E